MLNQQSKAIRIKRFVKIITIFLFLQIAYSCSSSDLLQHKEEGKGAHERGFTAALAKEYYYLGQVYRNANNWLDAEMFSDKGLAATLDLKVIPEDPVEWGVSITKINTLLDARMRLMNVLDNPMSMGAKPDLTAHVQVLYDCWVKEEEDHVDYLAILDCRSRFLRNLTYLESFLTGEIDDAPIIYEVANDYKIDMKLKNIASYTIYFDFDKSYVDPRLVRIFDRIADFIHNFEEYEIVIEGHTDRSGTELYNDGLSKNRAITVKDKMVEMGFDENTMTLVGFSERYPKVATRDNIEERLNRRAEIRIIGKKFKGQDALQIKFDNLKAKAKSDLEIEGEDGVYSEDENKRSKSRVCRLSSVVCAGDNDHESYWLYNKYTLSN